jgi:hypothetical protein
MDGRLADVALTAPESEVQDALVRFVEEGTARRVQAEWNQTDPDWWAADATFIE